MALGQLTNGVSVREMTQAYCALVNDGTFTYSRTYSMVTDSRGNIVLDNTPQTISAFEPNTAYCLTWMMKNAVQDTMRGDMVSGISHGVQAILTAFLIAGGALLAVEIMNLLTGGAA